MSQANLQGRVSIVTGASRGIGAATARLLAQAGSAVVVTARDETWLEMVARDVRNRGGRAIAVPADLTDIEMVEEVVESALGQFDRVDIVANCAGMVWPLEAAADADADEWAYSIHVNLVAPFTLANNVLPLMLDQGYGRIVNLTCRSRGEVRIGESALRAAKAGLEMWTRVVAKELESTGVAIACLDPGVVDTATRREILEIDAEEGEVDISAWLPDAAAADLCSPDEAARMIYWLLTEMDADDSHTLYSGSDSAWWERVRRDLGALAPGRKQ